jgi:hypothetical protein
LAVSVHAERHPRNGLGPLHTIGLAKPGSERGGAILFSGIDLSTLGGRARKHAETAAGATMVTFRMAAEGYIRDNKAA